LIAFIHPFIHLFIYSLTHLFFHLFIHSFIHAHLFICSFIPFFVHFFFYVCLFIFGLFMFFFLFICLCIYLLSIYLFFYVLFSAITRSSGIQVTKDSTFNNNSTNFLDPNIKVNYTDNEIILPTKQTQTLHSNSKVTNTSTTITINNGLSELLNSSRNVPTEKVVLSTSILSTEITEMNFTTVSPHGHHTKTAKHSYKILLYILIPVSVVVFLVVIYLTVRYDLLDY